MWEFHQICDFSAVWDLRAASRRGQVGRNRKGRGKDWGRVDGWEGNGKGKEIGIDWEREKE